MSDESSLPSIEEICKKHRQERKDLQAKIQALKKSATKGDKKKKKEVAETIDDLENELKRKHDAELLHLQPLVRIENNIIPKDENAVSEVIMVDEMNKDIEHIENKVSRAQKRRNKKQNAVVEREKRIAEQEEINKEGPRVVEMNTIKALLESEGLKIHNIPADGNCLYCAINHQLEVTGRPTLNITKLRKLTSTFMLDNKEELLPFMYNDGDDVIDDIGFEKYCKDVANTKLWGGHVELTALSNVLQCPIKVIQASGPSTLQGEEFIGPPLTLTYHKHLYRLGEHYNSTVKLSECDGISENDNFQEN